MDITIKKNKGLLLPSLVLGHFLISNALEEGVEPMTSCNCKKLATTRLEAYWPSFLISGIYLLYSVPQWIFKLNLSKCTRLMQGCPCKITTYERFGLD